MADKARILVVANRTAMCGELRQAMQERAAEGAAEFVLLVPATAHGASRAMDPYAEMGEATSHEEHAMQAMREAGLDVVEGRVGDPDPLAAVHDELNLNGPYDEIIVSTLPTHLSKWLKLDLPHKVEGMTDAPVRHVVGHEVKSPA